MAAWLLAISTLDQFDKSVDPTLAGTLAGLSLAAATFLIAFQAPLADKARTIQLLGGTPERQAEETVSAIKPAVGFLIASFYFFVLLLTESLTVDEWVEPHALLNGWREWALPADVALAGGTLACGVVLLGFGARRIYSLVAPTPPTAEPRPGQGTDAVADD